MDKLLITLKQLYELTSFRGDISEFKKSEKMIEMAIDMNNIVSNLKPHDLDKILRDRYYNHLIALTSNYLDSTPNVTTWTIFSQKNENKKVSKLIFDFGVKSYFFDSDGNLKRKVFSKTEDEASTRVTIEELYELCKINFNFTGSKTAFKRYIQNTYGSYAEYCLLKGYDINATRWEDPKAALRCAKKIGNIEDVKAKSMSLYNFLGENNLLDQILPTNHKVS